MIRVATPKEMREFRLQKAMRKAEDDARKRAGTQTIAEATEIINVGERTCRGVILVNPLGWGPKAKAMLPYILMDCPGALVILKPPATDEHSDGGLTLRARDLEGAGAVVVDTSVVTAPKYGEILFEKRLRNQSMPVDAGNALRRLSDGQEGVLFQAAGVNAAAMTRCRLKKEGGVPDEFMVYAVEAVVENRVDGTGRITIDPVKTFDGPKIKSNQIHEYKHELYGAGSDMHDTHPDLANCYYNACHILPERGDPYTPDHSYLREPSITVDSIRQSLATVLETGGDHLPSRLWNQGGMRAYLVEFSRRFDEAFVGT